MWRKNSVRDDVDRAHGIIRELVGRLSAVELAASARKTTGDWIDRALYGALCLLALFVAKKLGLL